jgi:RNA-binding protein 5/10
MESQFMVIVTLYFSATPDVSSYSYDESSGYYYDPQTTFYYDANSTYYYNSKTNSYCYWSQEHHTYLPAEGSNGKAGDDDGDKKKDDKKDKVKTAKKIAKDMEKWAKTLNQRKEAAKASQPASTGPAASTASSSRGLEDLAFSMLQKQTGPSSVSLSVSKPISMTMSRPEVQVQPQQPPPVAPSGLARLANYGSDSDNDDQVS